MERTGRNYTRQEVEQIFAKKIKADKERNMHFLADQKLCQLNKYLCGGRIEVEREYTIQDHMDIQYAYFSDGTVEEHNYGWAD